MKSSIRFGRVAPWLGACSDASPDISAPALAQTEAASTITKLTTVDVQQTGKPPTGPFRGRRRARSRARDPHDLPAARALDGRAPRARLGRRRLREERTHVPRVLERDRVARLRRHRRRPADRATGRRSDGAAAGGAPADLRPAGGAGPPADRFTHGRTARRSSQPWTGSRRESNDRNSRFYRKGERRAHRGDGHVLRRLDVVRRLERPARGDGRHLEQRPVRGRAQRRDLRRHPRLRDHRDGRRVGHRVCQRQARLRSHAGADSGFLRRASVSRPRRHLQPRQRRAVRRRRRRVAQVAAPGRHERSRPRLFRRRQLRDLQGRRAGKSMLARCPELRPRWERP